MKHAPFLFALLLALPATSQTHVKWTPAGRQVELASGQMRYQASAGQRNVQDSGGDWKPYDLQITGTDSGLPEVFLDDVRVAFDGYTQTWYEDDGVGGWDEQAVSTVHLERKQGPNWQRANIAKPLVVFTAQPEDLDAPAQILEAAYSFGNAQQTTWVTLHLGGKARVSWGIRLRAEQAGEYRVNIEWAETERGVAIVRKYKDGTDRPQTGMRWANKGKNGWDMQWRVNEEPDHDVTDDGTNVNAVILQGVYAQDETRELFPTTWGPTSVTADAEDAMSDVNGFDNCQYDGGLWVDDGDGSGAWHASFVRWLNVDLTSASTIDAGTQIVMDRQNDNSGANGVVRLCAEDSNNPSQPATGVHSRTYRGECEDHNFPSNAATQTIDMEAVIAGLVETAGYTYDGDDPILIGLGANNQFGISSVSWRFLSWDYCAAGDPAELTIVFTVGAAGTFPLVNNDPVFGLVNGGLTR